MPWTGAGAHVRARDSGSSTAQQDQVCRVPQEPVSTPSTFWGSSLQDTSNLLLSAESPAEMEGIWGCFFSSACKRVLHFEMAMSSESTSVKWGALGCFPQKHFAD